MERYRDGGVAKDEGRGERRVQVLRPFLHEIELLSVLGIAHTSTDKHIKFINHLSLHLQRRQRDQLGPAHLDASTHKMEVFLVFPFIFHHVVENRNCGSSDG